MNLDTDLNMPDVNDLHWSQLKEAGSLTGMKVLVFANRYGGRFVFRILLFPVICFYVIFRRQSCQASRVYLNRVHEFTGKFPRPRIWHIYQHFWSFGTALLDKLRVWTGAITLADVVVHNQHIIDKLLAEQRGALILMSHLGNFEICQALAEKVPGFSLTVLHHTRHAAKFNTLLGQYKGSSSVTLHQVTELDMGIAIQLGEKIGAGQFLAMSADRVAINNPDRSGTFDFLGHPAPFPSGPFILGLVLQAPIITVFCIKEGGRYHIYFETLWGGGSVKRGDRAALSARLTQDYVKKLEYHCQRFPLQWYNFYPFWGPDEK